MILKLRLRKRETMKILIVAATWMETGLLADEFKYLTSAGNFIKSYSYNYIDIDILVTGIGATFTTYHLTRALGENRYGHVINIGLAGSFCQNLEIGQVVNIVSEEFADLGVEKQDELLTLFEAGYIKPNEFPFENGLIQNKGNGLFANLAAARGITSNCIHSRPGSISQLRAKYKAQVESMEGAAVFYVCKQFGIPFSEIRAISNFTDATGHTDWNIPLALDNLRFSVIEGLNCLVPVEA